MKALEFKEQNLVFAKDQPEYLPLPVFKNDSPKGEVIFCMGLSFMERLRVLISGKIWVRLLTFNKPLTPSYLTTKKSEVLVTNKEQITNNE